MNVLKAIKVAELRKKLSIIPAKIIVALVLTLGVFVDFVNRENMLANTVEKIKSAPKNALFLFLTIYGAVSFIYIFIRLMHNWLLGLILSIGAAALIITQAGKLGGRWQIIALLAMLILGPVFDIINLLRYQTLKSEVIRAEEERIEESYGDGFDEGFARGLRQGERNERRRLRDYEEGYEDGYESHRRLRGHEDRRRLSEYDSSDGYESEDYDDDYEDSPRLRRDEAYDEYDSRRLDYDDYEDGYDEDEEDYDESGYDYAGSRSESSERYISGDSSNAQGFFADCKSPADIKRRYHDLCKVYHPDSGNGSAELFYRIKDEYDRLTASMS